MPKALKTLLDMSRRARMERAREMGSQVLERVLNGGEEAFPRKAVSAHGYVFSFSLEACRFFGVAALCSFGRFLHRAGFLFASLGVGDKSAERIDCGVSC